MDIRKGLLLLTDSLVISSKTNTFPAARKNTAVAAVCSRRPGRSGWLRKRAWKLEVVYRHTVTRWRNSLTGISPNLSQERTITEIRCEARYTTTQLRVFDCLPTVPKL